MGRRAAKVLVGDVGAVPVVVDDGAPELLLVAIGHGQSLSRRPRPTPRRHDFNADLPRLQRRPATTATPRCHQHNAEMPPTQRSLRQLSTGDRHGGLKSCRRGQNKGVLNEDGLALHLSRLPTDRPFTASQAAALGVHNQALRELVGAGHLRRPVRPAYVAAHLPDTLELRLSILREIVPEGSVVADHTAAWLHAGVEALLPGAHTSVGQPVIFRRPGKRALRNELVRSGQRDLSPGDADWMGGLLVTTPLRTALDIGRLFNRDVALWGVDSMMTTGAFSHEELLASVPRFNRQRGVRQLRWLTVLADAGSQSFGESSLRLRWRRQPPTPRLPAPVETELGTFYLDLGLEDEQFGGEYDGEPHHSDPADVERDVGRRMAITAEGRHVEVFRRHHVFGHSQDAEVRLKAAFRRWCAR